MGIHLDSQKRFWARQSAGSAMRRNQPIPAGSRVAQGAGEGSAIADEWLYAALREIRKPLSYEESTT